MAGTAKLNKILMITDGLGMLFFWTSDTPNYTDRWQRMADGTAEVGHSIDICGATFYLISVALLKFYTKLSHLGRPRDTWSW